MEPVRRDAVNATRSITERAHELADVFGQRVIANDDLDRTVIPTMAGALDDTFEKLESLLERCSEIVGRDVVGIAARERSIGEATISINGSINVDGQSPIALQRRFSAVNAALMAAGSIAQPIIHSGCRSRSAATAGIACSTSPIAPIRTINTRSGRSPRGAAAASERVESLAKS